MTSARSLMPEDRAPSGMLMQTIGDELRIHGSIDEAKHWYDRAIAWYRGRPLEEQARHSSTLGALLLSAGRRDDARMLFVEYAAAMSHNLEFRGYVGILAAQSGDRAEAERISLSLAEEERPQHFGLPTFQRACIAAQFGQLAQAVALLRESFGRGYPHGWRPRHAACLDPLRSYRPFRALMQPGG